jgi:hypothetical protein
VDSKAIGQILGPRFDAVSGNRVRSFNEPGLPAGAVILDLGTGNGNFAIYIASRGFQVLPGEPVADKSHHAGEDWSPERNESSVLENIRFEAFDAVKLPFGRNRSMRSFSPRFFIVSTKMSEAKFSAKPCGSPRRTESLFFPSRSAQRSARPYPDPDDSLVHGHIRSGS